jgi:hypothetical protein
MGVMLPNTFPCIGIAASEHEFLSQPFVLSGINKAEFVAVFQKVYVAAHRAGKRHSAST